MSSEPIDKINLNEALDIFSNSVDALLMLTVMQINTTHWYAKDSLRTSSTKAEATTLLSKSCGSILATLRTA